MINTVVLMGRLTYEPELRQTPNGASVLSFQIAVERQYQAKGEERKADFIDCTAWKQTAEFISRYFHKGSMIAVEGSIQTDNYTDKDGNKRKSITVLANAIKAAIDDFFDNNGDEVANADKIPDELRNSEGLEGTSNDLSDDTFQGKDVSDALDEALNEILSDQSVVDQIDNDNLAECIKSNNVHKEVGFVVKKITNDGSFKEAYDSEYTNLMPVAKSCVAKISDKVMQKKKSFKNNHQKKGSRIDLKSYSRRTSEEDLQVFSNRTKPNKMPEMAVMTVVDCSASMKDEKINIAKQTAILIEDFCTRLEIPNACMGHSTVWPYINHEDVEVYDCFDFDHSKNERYKIMGLCAIANNRDGYAFRIALDRLKKRREKFKVMIILSDGLPAANGYSGNSAKHDIQNFLDVAKKQGISVLSFYLGKSKSEYQRLINIYGDIIECNDFAKAPFNISKALEKESRKVYK